MKIVLFRNVFLYLIAAVYFGEALLALWAPQLASQRNQGADGHDRQEPKLHDGTMRRRACS